MRLGNAAADDSEFAYQAKKAAFRRYVQDLHREEEELTRLVLAPIGGPWKHGEVLGTAGQSGGKDLKRKAEIAFARFVGTTSEDHQRVPGQPLP